LISLVWIDFKGPLSSQTSDKPVLTQTSIDSLVKVIKGTSDRRTVYAQFEQLETLGIQAKDAFIKLLSDEIPYKREFAADALGDLRVEEAVKPLISLLNDESFRVRNSSVIALGKIGNKEAIGPLIDILKSGNDPAISNFIYSTLASLEAHEAWEYIAEGTKKMEWWNRVSALNALNSLDSLASHDYIYTALGDEEPNVRRSAVLLIIHDKPSNAKEPLMGVLDDEDFETRFYARQALKIID
jgi:HEAT repeat protein